MRPSGNESRVTRQLLLLVAILALAGCGGGEDNSANQSTEPDQPAQTQATTADSDAGGGEDDGLEAGDPSAGADVFASAGCGGCHTYAPAGSSGSVGPNLDETQIDFGGAVRTITNGRGGMPSFEDQLSETEIRDVAAYVVQGPGAGGADDE